MSFINYLLKLLKIIFFPPREEKPKRKKREGGGGETRFLDVLLFLFLNLFYIFIPCHVYYFPRILIKFFHILSNYY